ncbi:MAG: hypothetical protein LR015_04680 [Verrucomicrobia bacterium]|nr:hypothetical protein [Verrucomicrobiota bacterium]
MSDNAFSLAKFYCLRYLLGDSALAEADMVPGVMEAIQDHLTARGIQESLSAFVEALVEVSGIESTGAAQQRGLRLLDAGSIPGQPLFVRPCC